MKRILKYQISEEEETHSLEWILKNTLGLSRRQISQAKFREDGICLNGVRTRVTGRGKAGQWLDVCLEEEGVGSHHLLPNQGQVQILYEDADLLAVCKPSDLTVHPSPGHYADSLANRLVHYFNEKGESVRIRAVGRLDLETSGLVIFAKNQAAAGRLAEQRERGIFKKTYLALVTGKMPERSGRIDRPIGAAEHGRMQVHADGKRAVTDYLVLKEEDTFSAVAVTLQTGRTHQIRVHMASIGHPLLGDVSYGGVCGAMKRAALHAWKAQLLQPFTGEEISLEAEIPEDLGQFFLDR